MYHQNFKTNSYYLPRAKAHICIRGFITGHSLGGKNIKQLQKMKTNIAAAGLNLYIDDL